MISSGLRVKTRSRTGILHTINTTLILTCGMKIHLAPNNIENHQFKLI